MGEAAELGNYRTQKDIEICIGFDLGWLADNAGIANIRELHDALAENYTVHGTDVGA